VGFYIPLFILNFRLTLRASTGKFIGLIDLDVILGKAIDVKRFIWRNERECHQRQL
jgi:hypothetical protein